MLLTRLCLVMYATPRMLKLLLFCFWPSWIVVPFDRSILIVTIGLFVNRGTSPAKPFLGGVKVQSVCYFNQYYYCRYYCYCYCNKFSHYYCHACWTSETSETFAQSKETKDIEPPGHVS